MFLASLVRFLSVTFLRDAPPPLQGRYSLKIEFNQPWDVRFKPRTAGWEDLMLPLCCTVGESWFFRAVGLVSIPSRLDVATALNSWWLAAWGRSFLCCLSFSLRPTFRQSGFPRSKTLKMFPSTWKVFFTVFCSTYHLLTNRWSPSRLFLLYMCLIKQFLPH